MIMDVEGRTSDERPGKGRWVVTKCNNPGNVLTFGELGLAPAPTHQGVVMAKSIGDSGRRHVSGPESKDEKRSGKKSVEVVHALNSEDTKRVAGRYGLRKVPTVEPAVTKDRQRKGAAPSQTSEQRAEKLVSSLIAKDPSLAPQFGDALKSGGVALLAAEKQLRRVQEVQQRAEFQAAAAAKQPPRRHADAANLSSITAPYETNVVGLDNNQAYRPHRRQFAPPVPHDAEVRGKRHLATPGATASVPYDNADGTVPYPAPPQCGVRTPLMQTRPGKRLLEAPTDNRDVDTVSLQRAAVRASRDTTAPTFLFGAHDGAPASAPAVKASPPRHREVGLSLLDHDFKAPVEASRKASRFAEQTHRKTALW